MVISSVSQGVIQGEKLAIKLVKTVLGEYSKVIHRLLSMNLLNPVE